MTVLRKKNLFSIIVTSILIHAAPLGAHINALDQMEGQWFEPPKEINAGITFITGKNTPKDAKAVFSRTWSLLYVGYAGCRSTCPTDLAKITQFYKQNSKELENTPFYFLTADPGNDSNEKLSAYLNAFDSQFNALTASQSDTEQFLELIESPLRILESNDGEIIHSSHLYLIGPDLRAWKSYSFPFSSSEIKHDLRQMTQQFMGV